LRVMLTMREDVWSLMTLLRFRVPD
jgi:hypothetical protein